VKKSVKEQICLGNFFTHIVRNEERCGCTEKNILVYERLPLTAFFLSVSYQKLEMKLSHTKKMFAKAAAKMLEGANKNKLLSTQIQNSAATIYETSQTHSTFS